MAVVWIGRGHCPSYRQGMSVGTYADYRHCTGLAGCLYGVIFDTSHYFFVISLMEPIRFVYYPKFCFNESLSRGGQHFILNIDIYPIYFD